MEITYSITPNVMKLIETRIEALGISDFRSHYFPSIMWALGGHHIDGNQKEELPPHYALGYIKRENLPKMVALKNPTYEFIAFRPSPDDALSEKTVIDHDEKGFYLR